MQSAKPGSPDSARPQGMTADEQELLRQAMSLFNLQVVQPVAMAFPTVITDTADAAGRIAMMDVHQLFRQQELLFNGLQTAEPAAAPHSDPATSAAGPEPGESAELKAIQQMYGQS